MEQHVNEHKTDPTVMDRVGMLHLNDSMLGRMQYAGYFIQPGKEREGRPIVHVRKGQ
jgi:hypothetical protein